ARDGSRCRAAGRRRRGESLERARAGARVCRSGRRALRPDEGGPMIGLTIILTLLPAMPTQSDYAETVLTRLVFGCHLVPAAAAAGRDPQVTARVGEVDERCRSFEARTPAPLVRSERGMVAR